jgi:hypothetical protein
VNPGFASQSDNEVCLEIIEYNNLYTSSHNKPGGNLKTKKCINCGKHIPVDARLCPYCGEILKVDLPVRPQTEVLTPQKDRKGFAIVSLVLGTSFLMLAGLYSIFNDISPDLGGAIGTLALFSPFLSVPGIIFGILGIRSKLKALSVAGIVINSIVFFLLVIIGCVITLLSANWLG